MDVYIAGGDYRNVIQRSMLELFLAETGFREKDLTVYQPHIFSYIHTNGSTFAARHVFWSSLTFEFQLCRLKCASL